jgi:hypothetical protein
MFITTPGYGSFGIWCFGAGLFTTTPTQIAAGCT